VVRLHFGPKRVLVNESSICRGPLRGHSRRIRRKLNGASDFAERAAVEGVQVGGVGARGLRPDELPLDTPVEERNFLFSGKGFVPD
jgi:hypothetical protein